MRGYYGRPRHGMRRNPRSGHTPGPWYVQDEYEGTIPIDAPVASTGYDESQEICRVSSQDEEAMAANARLIAAAPVMRDALVEARKALNTVFGHRCFTEGQQQQIGEALESVIKAIEDTKLFSERERLGG
jgi:hypothetical protein